MKTIDITPTWRGVLPMLIEVAQNADTAEGRKNAMAELYRLADIADNAKPYKVDPDGSFEEVQVTVQAPMEMPHDEIAERLTRGIESALGVEAVRAIKYEAEIYSGEDFGKGRSAKRDPLAGIYGSESQEATAKVTRSDLETVAACAAELMQHPQQEAFYARFSDDMGGFTGFYQAAIDLAAPINAAVKKERFFFETVPFFDLIDRITNEYISRSLEKGERVKDFGALFAGVHGALKAEDEAATARVASFKKGSAGAKL